MVKQKDKIYSSRVNFFNENEEYFQNDKKYLREIEAQKYLFFLILRNYSL